MSYAKTARSTVHGQHHPDLLVEKADNASPSLVLVARTSASTSWPKMIVQCTCTMMYEIQSRKAKLFMRQKK